MLFTVHHRMRNAGRKRSRVHDVNAKTEDETICMKDRMGAEILLKSDESFTPPLLRVSKQVIVRT